MEKMYCSLCHKEFKTYTEVKTVYRNYEPCEEEQTYPINAHLLSGYICDECYNNLPDIVRNLILEAGQEYINTLPRRQDEAKKRYLAELKSLAARNENITEMRNIVDTHCLSELPADTVYHIIALDGTYPYSKGSAYLEKAIQIEKENISHIKNTTSFEYLSYHFTPVKRLSNEEYNLKNVSSHIRSDVELGMSDYDWGKLPWNYKDFYEASGGSNMDIFQCEENGKSYLPGGHELFQYV